MNAIDKLAFEASREIAREESKNIHQKRRGDNAFVIGAKKNGGRNSDATEVFGYNCPCGFEINKKHDERSFERIMRLHIKVCKHPDAKASLIQNEMEISVKGVVRHDTFYDVVRFMDQVRNK